MQECNYDLEIENIVKAIKEKEAKRVLLQFPDGLKPYAKEVVSRIENEFEDITVLLWGGSNYGACDQPAIDCDLLVAFGHSKWN